MSMLSRYLLRTHLFLTLLTLASGVGIYLLTDLFDRLDDMIGAGISVGLMATYFVVKMPLIISQILPAVFLLATVMQLCFMAHTRELTALQAGGVSFLRLARFFIVYALIGATVQLAFSQYVGIAGQKESSRIWKEDIKKRTRSTAELENVWFTENSYLVHIDTLLPNDKKGQGISIYLLSHDGLKVEQIVQAKSFYVTKHGWHTENCTVTEPARFSAEHHDAMLFDIKQNVSAFTAMSDFTDPAKLPIWQLHDAINKLQASGSNVEALQTAWHAKLAYAGALVSMVLLALALITWSQNIYANMSCALFLVFLFYVCNTLGVSLGEKSILPPALAGWGANIIFGGLAFLRLVYASYIRR